MELNYWFKGTSGYLNKHKEKQGYWEEELSGIYSRCGNYVDSEKDGIWYNVINGIIVSKESYNTGWLMYRVVFTFNKLKYITGDIGTFSLIHQEDYE